MKLDIRKMEPEDIAGVLELLKDFAAYEKLSEYCTATAERFSTALFGGEAIVEGLVAHSGSDLAAYALFYPSFSSFRGERGMYLEDIYIKPDYRGSGSGRLFIQQVARIAAKRGFERIDFQVLDWNTPAIEFYKNLGAESNPGETHFKFAGEAFAALAAEY